MATETLPLASLLEHWETKLDRSLKLREDFLKANRPTDEIDIKINLIKAFIEDLKPVQESLVEREQALQQIQAVHQEKMRHLRGIQKYVWEQYRRKILEMEHVGKNLDFVLAIPTFHPQSGEPLSVEKALALTPLQETHGEPI